MSSFNIAISGLNAASTRISVSASNLANKDSNFKKIDGQTVKSPYDALQAQNISLQTGGVQSIVKAANPSTKTIYNPTDAAADPDTGLVQTPNVDVEKELVNMQIARYDYRANLAVVKTQQKLEDELLKAVDIKA
jgi:flagellar basal-body rod protein FlgC